MSDEAIEKQSENTSHTATSLLNGIGLKKKWHLALVLLIAVQGLILSWLVWQNFSTNSPALTQTHYQKDLLDLWERLGEKARQEGNIEQAVYFYEKLLPELPAAVAAQKQLQAKLSHLYSQLLQEKQAKHAATPVAVDPVFGQSVPAIYQMAEQTYHQGNYAEARRLFYVFLLQSDQNEQSQKLVAHAYFRIQQCRLPSVLVAKTAHDPVLFKAFEQAKK